MKVSAEGAAVNCLSDTLWQSFPGYSKFSSLFTSNWHCSTYSAAKEPTVVQMEATFQTHMDVTGRIDFFFSLKKKTKKKPHYFRHCPWTASENCLCMSDALWAHVFVCWSRFWNFSLCRPALKAVVSWNQISLYYLARPYQALSFVVCS